MTAGMLAGSEACLHSQAGVVLFTAWLPGNRSKLTPKQWEATLQHTNQRSTERALPGDRKARLAQPVFGFLVRPAN